MRKSSWDLREEVREAAKGIARDYAAGFLAHDEHEKLSWLQKKGSKGLGLKRNSRERMSSAERALTALISTWSCLDIRAQSLCLKNLRRGLSAEMLVIGANAGGTASVMGISYLYRQLSKKAYICVVCGISESAYSDFQDSDRNERERLRIESLDEDSFKKTRPHRARKARMLFRPHEIEEIKTISEKCELLVLEYAQCVAVDESLLPTPKSRCVMALKFLYELQIDDRLDDEIRAILLNLALFQSGVGPEPVQMPSKVLADAETSGIIGESPEGVGNNHLVRVVAEMLVTAIDETEPWTSVVASEISELESEFSSWAS